MWLSSTLCDGLLNQVGTRQGERPSRGRLFQACLRVFWRRVHLVNLRVSVTEKRERSSADIGVFSLARVVCAVAAFFQTRRRDLEFCALFELSRSRPWRCCRAIWSSSPSSRLRRSDAEMLFSVARPVRERRGRSVFARERTPKGFDLVRLVTLRKVSMGAVSFVGRGGRRRSSLARVFATMAALWSVGALAAVGVGVGPSCWGGRGKQGWCLRRVTAVALAAVGENVGPSCWGG